MNIHLESHRMQTKEEAHAYLQELLGFPDYYGHNLDALWDMLMERSEPLTLYLSEEIDPDSYAYRIVNLLREASLENPAILLRSHDAPLHISDDYFFRKEDQALLQSLQEYPLEEWALEELRFALTKSLCTLSAWRDHQLVGYLYICGDGKKRIYFEDINGISPQVQHALVQELLTRYPEAKEILFMCENRISELIDWFEEAGYQLDTREYRHFFREV